MYKLFFLLFSYGITTSGYCQSQKFVSVDIDHFWTAYDKITRTTDSAKQYGYLQEYYLDKASPGLKSLMEVKQYTAKQYIDAINAYPDFWKTIRPNTDAIPALLPSVNASVKKLKKIYPALKPSTIYFSIGAFRSNGTTQKNKVLIGSEMALANDAVNITGLPTLLHFFYKNFKPLDNIALLCTHEYVHTQQKEMVYNLLCITLYEGVPEFVSCLACGKPSNTPSFSFGRQNESLVKKTFTEEMFLPNNLSNWMWGENQNALKERDLGYYVGYRICEEYYKRSANKKQAVKEMIELDYRNDTAVENFVNRSGFFSGTVQQLNDDYEQSRPTVVGMTPFANGDSAVKPGVTTITIHFSMPLNQYNTGIDFGPLGESYCPKINPQNRKWSEDGRSWTFEATLQPNQRYQLLISNNFRLANGVRLKPYLIDFTTTD